MVDWLINIFNLLCYNSSIRDLINKYINKILFPLIYRFNNISINNKIIIYIILFG